MRRKAFTDTGKWMIFKSPITKKWTVTPPLGVDADEWEADFDTFAYACVYFRLAIIQFTDFGHK